MIFPNIDPVIFSVGPFSVKWYSLAYIAGILLGCYVAAYINNIHNKIKDFKPFDDLLVYLVLSIILGGRIGYVLFYNFEYYISNPLEIFAMWHGGMSFHGGLIGTIVGMYIYCKRRNIGFYTLSDIAAVVTPIGLFFGRIANFINGELYGRQTDSAFGVIFPNGGEIPRHPSQLYEAALEGLLLFVILFSLARFSKIMNKTGALSGMFLVGYSLARSFIEFFREPDEQIGFLFNAITMGQALSLPMFLFGLYLIFRKTKSA